MSEIKLFEVGTVVKERTSSTVVLEKQLQTTIEQNMETFFGVRFLKSEYMITSGRMDSIGIDENNSPVIFEYKRSWHQQAAISKHYIRRFVTTSNRWETILFQTN